jgi:hypothetical protein
MAQWAELKKEPIQVDGLVDKPPIPTLLELAYESRRKYEVGVLAVGAREPLGEDL